MDGESNESETNRDIIYICEINALYFVWNGLCTATWTINIQNIARLCVKYKNESLV